MSNGNTPAWSSQFAAYLATIGAAVGLGSIWRFPYLAGTLGGGTFIGVFVLACMFIATPLLTAEFMIGRHARLPPTLSPGVLAVSIGASRRWNAIGTIGTLAVFLIGSYYTLIAGWIVAYAVKCMRGDLVGLARPAVQAEWRAFLSNPWQLMGWQLLFLVSVGYISGRGVGRGIEVASRIRAPALLVLLLLLDGYAVYTGDVAAAMHFAFAPHWEALSAGVMLAAIGQAFFATGVGCAMMLSYGSYMSPDASLVRPALAISSSILLASLLATLLVFPLVFRYHMDPAGGPALVFDVLPTMFAVMPAGRLVGTVFFVLLIFAALTPMLACFEPLVGWLGARGWSRPRAAAASAVQRPRQLAPTRSGSSVCRQDPVRSHRLRCRQLACPGRGAVDLRAYRLAARSCDIRVGAAWHRAARAANLSLAVALCCAPGNWRGVAARLFAWTSLSAPRAQDAVRQRQHSGG